MSKLSCVGCTTKIWEQMSGPDLHVFTLNFLALKKLGFSPHRKYFPKLFWLLFTFILCNFSVQILKYFQENLSLLFVHKNLKNRPEKLLIISPTLFFTVQPRPQPTAQNWLFILFMKSRYQTSVLLSVVHYMAHVIWCMQPKIWGLDN